ncbi:MAG TPA: FtsW/RodA/SpoVE family cell cycle protein [Anaerolineaceae bacterium]|nr:FtsW/RodA/SpoVE family cell cycle protein [Anaerolineaceae bacterium]
MNRLFPSTPSEKDFIQSRLMVLAAIFLFLYSLILTFSPAVRYHDWNVTYRWTQWIGYAVWLAGFVVLHREVRARIPERDPYLLPIVAMLSGLGLLTIWRLDGQNILWNGFGFRQTIWMALAILVVWLGIRYPIFLSWLRRYKYIWLTGGLLLMVLTTIIGIYPSGEGPGLWLRFGGLYIQPSEILKLLLVVYLAAYLADRVPINLNLMQLIAPTVILISAATLLLIAQRDLGTASIFILLYFTIIYMASGKRRIMIFGAVLIATAAVGGYFRFGVIKLRIDAWLNPWADAGNQSYQLVQSLIAIASGGLLGSGPGLGSPGVVPVSHSDFIFASIAEELGLAGTFAILLLFGLLVVRGILTALRARNAFQRYLAAGLSMYLGIQAVIIMGGNLRLIPLTGVTLPFVSYGGSSLLISFFSSLILLLISNQPKESPAGVVFAFPYKLASLGVLVGLAAIALMNGYYAVIRSESIAARNDNPRWAINDQYVVRGKILDRHNNVISQTSGETGQYTRTILYPALSNTAGYSNPIYGQGGIEASQDGYLRGLEGIPYSHIFWQDLLYNQPPTGLDIRLSISLELQKVADDLLGDKKGALVLLNAQSGEILALSSHPGFDANQLDTLWETWKDDPDAPLLNRATQGQYPLGTVLAPFMLSALESQGGTLPQEPATWRFSLDNGTMLDCAIQPTGNTWYSAVQAGCPQASIVLGRQLALANLTKVYGTWGFDETPVIPVASARPSKLDLINNLVDASLGQGDFRVSPLQVALAAAAYSTGGQRPSPLLAMAVNTPRNGWVILPVEPSRSTYPRNVLVNNVEKFTLPGTATWQTVGQALTEEGTITWVIGGTVSSWQGTPLALALVIEEDNPEYAQFVVGQVLAETMQ